MSRGSCRTCLYIIKIPVHLNDDPERGLYSLVQVGSTAVLRTRLLQHRQAWWYATGVDMFPGITHKGKPQLDCFENLIGVLIYSSSSSSSEQDHLKHDEQNVREHIGTKFSAIVAQQLLTQPFVSQLGGVSILKKGAHFSHTELRIVHDTELKNLCLFFKTTPSRRSTTDDFYAYYCNNQISIKKLVTIRSSVNYIDVCISKFTPTSQHTRQEVVIDSSQLVILPLLLQQQLDPQSGTCGLCPLEKEQDLNITCFLSISSSLAKIIINSAIEKVTHCIAK